MSKSTINLSSVLEKLTSPMEKVAAEVKKVDAVETPAAEVGEEKKVEEPKKEEKKTKESEELKKEDKDTDYEKKPEMKKEASETPVSGLEKLASDLAEVEHRTMIKEAGVFGSVMADSFANRLAEIQTVVDESEDTDFDKTAAEFDYMEKVATELYVNMNEEEAGLVNELIKTASDNGMEVSPEQAFSALADEAIAMGESAAFQKIATEQVMTKLASEDHAQIDGFMKTAALMGQPCTKEEAFQYMAKTAMENGASVAISEVAQVEKTAAVQETNNELEAMEKVAAEMEANGDKEGVASLEKYAYDKGFEETLVKVAAQTSGVAYAQTELLMK